MNIHEYRKKDEMQEIKSNYLVDYETVFKGIPRVKRRMFSNYFGWYLIFINGRYYKKVIGGIPRMLVAIAKQMIKWMCCCP